MSKIKMIPSSIINVPLQSYSKDFTFIVNGKEFSTSRLFSDLISRKISQMHLQDPTIDTYTITTQHSGDFSRYLNLFTFKEVTFPDSEIEFITEIIEELGNESIEIIGADTTVEITNDNVFEIIQNHLKFPTFYSENIKREIDFISHNFFTLYEKKKNELIELPKDVLFQILKNDQLRLESEDELIDFVNELYTKDAEYSILYELVEFDKVSIESISEFIAIFDYNELTNITWQNITKRLQLEIKKKPKKDCCKKCQPFTSEISKTGDGLLCSLDKKQQNPFDKLFIASQSSNDIYNLIDPNTKDEFNLSEVGEFVEIELQEPVSITGVKIFSTSYNFPRKFDIEINDDQVKSVQKATKLNGANRSMTVSIHSEKCQKVRITNQGQNWDLGDNSIFIRRIELISKDERFRDGVFATLIAENEEHDPHKCPVFMSSSNLDLNTFHSINTSTNICTNPNENSWFQIELTKGEAVLSGFRLKRSDPGKLRNYKIICTDDARKPKEEWTTLVAIDEQKNDEHEELDIYQFEQRSPPAKFVRLIQTGPNWSDILNLVFIHFDLFGDYLA